ncbi:MAG: O-antigen ligase family protein [Planctomycetales bacterium]|nr:O-antigen ligase family protein [Planctomycetales bacterium]
MSSKRRSSHSSQRTSDRSRNERAKLDWTDILAWAARSLIFLVLVVCPWPYGMAHWQAMVWLIPAVSLILLIAFAVAIKKKVAISSPLAWSICGILVIALLQIVPLPEVVWSWLSPSAGLESEVQTLTETFATSDAASGAVVRAPRTVSIHPLQTSASFTVLAIGFAFLLSCTILFRDRTSCVLLFSVLAISGSANVAIGIYQAIVADGWTLLADMKSTSFSTFISRNSAPQYTVCCLASAAILLLLHHRDRNDEVDRRYRLKYPSVNPIARIRRRVEEFVSDADPWSITYLILLIVLAAGILIANSRGGILACSGAAVVTVLAIAFGKQMSSSGTMVIVLLLAGCSLFLSTFELDEAIGQRLETVSEEAYERDNERLTLWGMALSQSSAWILGSGLGTFHFAILPAYQTPTSVWFYHAENIVIEVLSNCGPLAALGLIFGVGWLIWQLLTKQPPARLSKAIRLGCILAVLAIGLQSLVDFSLILPSVFLPLGAIVGAYLGTKEYVEKSKRKRRRSRSKSSQSRSQSKPDRSAPSASTHSEPVLAAESAGSAAPQKTAEVHVAPNKFWPATLVFSSAILLAVLLGSGDLRSFATAEYLASLNSNSGEVDSSTIDSEFARLTSDYPEIQFQIARRLQDLAQSELALSKRWPEQINDTMRRSLARPEFFTASFAPNATEEVKQLRDQLVDESAVLEHLHASRAGMLSVLAASPWDWRASWGLLRADLGDASQFERVSNYFRIMITCKNSPQIIQAAATHAVMSGETIVGLELWRELLSSLPRVPPQVANMLDHGLSFEQLEPVLPENPLIRLAFAKQLDSMKRAVEAERIYTSIDLSSALASANKNAERQLVIWAAEKKGDVEIQIQGLNQAAQAALSSSDQGNYRYAVAKALLSAQRPDEALSEIDRALNLAPNESRYVELRREILEFKARL